MNKGVLHKTAFFLITGFVTAATAVNRVGHEFELPSFQKLKFDWNNGNSPGLTASLISLKLKNKQARKERSGITLHYAKKYAQR